MICEKTVKKYCKNFTKIENYEEAMLDTAQTYDCHHRKEIEGNTIRSKQELIAAGIYYDRPAEELIFLTHAEHRRLHTAHLKESTKQKISEAQKGKIHSEKTKQKMSEAKRGNKNPVWKGKVQCIETGKIYECGHDAEKELGIGNIGLACKGIYKTAGGYHWRYYN